MSYITNGSGILFLLSPSLEKFAEQFAGAPLFNAAIDFRPMMRRRLIEQAGPALDRAALRGVRAEIQPAHAGPSDCLRGHLPRVGRDTETAFPQTRPSRAAGHR